MSILQFEPFSSQIDGTFWEKLGKLKIDYYKLDDSEKEIYGYYRGGERANDSVTALPARLFLSSGSFDKEHASFSVVSPGILKNTNTLNEFKDLDKNAFLKNASSKIWEAIKDGSVIDQPQLLVQFGLITFADLKKYKYYYWFNFPCLLPKNPFTYTKSQYLPEIYSESQLDQLKQAFHDFYDKAPNCNFFLYKSNGHVFGKLNEWSTFWSNTKDDQAWGVRHITFVDNGKVSYSNPVRQPLFTFEDCLDGGLPKAKAAAKRLSEVFPGVKAAGYDVSIPMPGHLVDAEIVTRANVEKLEQMVEDHDVVFLLTDSRESRWLPTVIGAKYKKIVINTALGFDSFLVMRHGMREIGENVDTRLGCYFCNDVVAPVDSLTDRTLDQQCTVTRPGLSAVAAGLAVELLASICNHPEGPWAPADQNVSVSDSANSTVLGVLPHQIRGFLSHFQNLVLVGAGYNKCSACSDPVLQQYEQDGIDFLIKAMKDSNYLEKVAGLDQMKMESENIDVDWDEDM
ncbi:Autophagy protein 7 [Boothiomyces macroporosus]|uniref:Ubiquitin-like modifier-activating enzyme ATG7 n=1 Tax=Boothiomyces macroporosus TaxID=261099 RepID=A0AAD5UD44_9FUNG|nr:Autophagy protein 7 [Boothiomyces macroporosus]